MRAKAATQPHATGREGASARATTTDAAIATAPISSRRRSAIAWDVDTFRFPVEGRGRGRGGGSAPAVTAQRMPKPAPLERRNAVRLASVASVRTRTLV